MKRIDSLDGGMDGKTERYSAGLSTARFQTEIMDEKLESKIYLFEEQLESRLRQMLIPTLLSRGNSSLG